MIKFPGASLESDSCILNCLKTIDIRLTYSNRKRIAVVKSSCITLSNPAKANKLLALAILSEKKWFNYSIYLFFK